MSKFTDIIKEDFGNLGELLEGIPAIAYDCVKGTTKGFCWGLYTPFNLRSGMKHLAEDQSYTIGKPLPEYLTETYAQLLTLIGHSAIAVTSINQGLGAQYLGLLGATNVGAYLIDTYRKSRKQ